jgi:PAS domain S-box-containing protein
MVLGSKFPACIVWGSDLITIYNDAFRPILGAKPEALGRPFNEVWSEAWDEIAPIADRAFAGEATFIEHFPLVVERNGYPEETYFTFCYSPIRDETGGVVGFIDTVIETTSEVKTRTALQAESERLRGLFQQAPGFMCILRGPDLVYEVANKAYMQLVGLNRDIIGKPIREALPEVEGQRIFEHLDEAMRKGKPFTGRNLRAFLQRTPSAPPTEVFVDVLFQPLRGEGGGVTGIFIEGVDVSERLRAEAALRESEARHRQIVNSAADYAIIATDLEGRVHTWNEGARRVLGWSEEDMLGQTAERIFTPEDVAANEPAKEMRTALQNGVALDERWHLRKGGERFWANGELTPLRDDAGSTVGFVKVLRDRTEQRRAEETLRQHGILVESMTEGVSLSDEHGFILYTNRAEDRMFGYGPGELVGQHVTVQNAYSPDENRERVNAVMARLKAHGSWEGEWRNRRKDGSEFITASRITAVEIHGRRNWLCVQRDITDAKRAEEHQRLLINELNHRVKNTLATVQSIASQTFKGGHESAKREAFEGRLFALATAHDVLTREHWEGAELREIVVKALAPFQSDGLERFDLAGPELRLIPRSALALAMAIHELAVNAAKYGALSIASGRVIIRWLVSPGEPRHLTFRWEERGGPTVAPPTRKGFGTRLIERSLALELSGQVKVSYEPSGVVCVIQAPLEDETRLRHSIGVGCFANR